MFRKYTPDDFDKHHYLKAPIGFYFLLLMLLRPYIIWVVSVANRSDATVLIQSLYPDKNDFFVGLISGIGALIVTVCFSQRRDKTFNWLPSFWQYSKPLLWLSLLVDLLLTMWVIKHSHYSFKIQYAAIFCGLFFSALYLFKSTRLTDFFANWPQEALKGYQAPQESTSETTPDLRPKN
jgi:hypothetical protein